MRSLMKWKRRLRALGCVVDAKNIATLELAITKAIENGYVPPYRTTTNTWRFRHRIIFSHDFAKSLWGDGDSDLDDDDLEHGIALEDWRHHLQQMVIADDPLKYLSEYLEQQPPAAPQTPPPAWV